MVVRYIITADAILCTRRTINLLTVVTLGGAYDGGTKYPVGLQCHFPGNMGHSDLPLVLILHLFRYRTFED